MNRARFTRALTWVVLLSIGTVLLGLAWTYAWAVQVSLDVLSPSVFRWWLAESYASGALGCFLILREMARRGGNNDLELSVVLSIFWLGIIVVVPVVIVGEVLNELLKPAGERLSRSTLWTRARRSMERWFKGG
jgi:hypothetical protein